MDNRSSCTALGLIVCHKWYESINWITLLYAISYTPVAGQFQFWPKLKESMSEVIAPFSPQSTVAERPQWFIFIKLSESQLGCEYLCLLSQLHCLHARYILQGRLSIYHFPSCECCYLCRLSPKHIKKSVPTPPISHSPVTTPSRAK